MIAPYPRPCIYCGAATLERCDYQLPNVPQLLRGKEIKKGDVLYLPALPYHVYRPSSRYQFALVRRVKLAYQFPEHMLLVLAGFAGQVRPHRPGSRRRAKRLRIFQSDLLIALRPGPCKAYACWKHAREIDSEVHHCTIH